MNRTGRWLHQLRKIGVLLLLVLLAIFSLQNLGTARIEFLTWSIEAPRGLIYAMLFLAGALTGLLIRRQRGGARQSDANIGSH